MSIEDSVTWHGIDEFVEGVLSEADERVVALNPTADLLRELSLADADVQIDVVADEQTAKEVYDDFIAASNAAVSVREETFTVRYEDGLTESPILATAEFYATPVYTANATYGVPDANADSAEEVYENANELFENVGEEPYPLRTPPIDTVRETLAAEVGEELRDDFNAVLDQFDDLSMRGTGIDAVEALIVLAARREQLLYDVSKWGEDVGLASKATFSRAKSRLEERDLINTVKVPIDVGRPRLRLLLPEEDRDSEPVELVAEAAEQFDR